MTSSVLVAECIDNSVDKIQTSDQKQNKNKLWLFIAADYIDHLVVFLFQRSSRFHHSKTPACSCIVSDPPQACSPVSRPEEPRDSQKQTYRYEDAKPACDRCMGKQMTDFTPIRLHNS